MLLNKYYSVVWLVVGMVAFCSCGSSLATGNPMLAKKSDDDSSVSKEQRTCPLYSDSIFYRYVRGTVFFIIGTSSSGKSSIINELSQHIPLARKNEFLISGHDDLYRSLTLKNIRSKFTGKLRFTTQRDLWYCFLATQVMPRENIVANLDTDVIFKKHEHLLLSDEWYSIVSQLNSCPLSADDELFFAENLMLNVVKGKNIVLDVVNFMPFLFTLESNFIRCNAYNVYVYSPPHVLIKHIVQRLQNSLLTVDKEEMRLFFPYAQYLDLYTISRFKTDLCLTKKEMLSDFSDILLRTIKNSGLSGHEKDGLIEILEKRKIEEDLWRKKVSFEWFSGNKETIYLIPKCKNVDLLLNTSFLSPIKAASFILPVLNSVINQDGGAVSLKR